MPTLKEQLANDDPRQLCFNVTGAVRRHLLDQHIDAPALHKMLDTIDDGLLDITQWEAWVLLDFPPCGEYRIGPDCRKELDALLKLAQEEQ